ncbi:anti-sigma factor domain-containing protein [Metabacillus litoralis]|uniref:Anti-sigma factor domain-containing protein n=1 Tax=Metabacillus litoralis TaxID=152268 RepID=A0A5C6W0Y5_9BACI|nr:anti-sigma factor domain-containing protein [Metabacillus litoralis]TXC91555.1 anti-sigma factor domain-containing protein [Metabacillus litoralis]
MKRGVVVDRNDDFITLLTPEGQFLKANNEKGMYEIGEEITFFPLVDKLEEAATRESKLLKNRVLSALSLKRTRVGALSFLAIMVFIFSFLPGLNQNKAYAYMSIDINPSFEVKIDQKLKVLSLDPINEEAEKLMIELPNWEGKSFVEVVNTIVTQSKSEGYVYPGKEILIATVVNQEDKKIEEKLTDNIEQIRHSMEDDEMIVKTIETDSETREKAKKQGISTGKYLELTNDKEVEDKKEDFVKPKSNHQEETTSTQKEIDNTPVPVQPKVNNNSEWKNETKERLKETQNKIKENSKPEKWNEVKEEHIDKSKEVRKNEKAERKADRERQRNEKRENKKDMRNNERNHHKQDDDNDDDDNDERDRDEYDNDKHDKEDD